MALSDRQIERYSRQIVVPGIGGIGQLRLLAANIAMVGKPEDLQAQLTYLVGAGIDRIYAPVDGSTIDDLRRLNPDVQVIAAGPARWDLTLAMVGDAASLAAARRAVDAAPGRFAIIARLDSPPRLASLAASPCPRCASLDLLADFGARAEQAEYIAMLAAAEAIRTLATAEKTAPRVVEFEGYEARAIAIGRRADVARCACESSHADG